MADRQHQTNRANFRGVNTRLNADGMPLGKYPMCVNMVADGDTRIRTRPGYLFSFITASRLTDMRAYATLGTDEKPRLIVHDSSGGVWLDDGVKKGTVGVGGIGASLVTYRPNQSPQSWMYVANSTGYKKFSSPDNANNVIVQKTGIAEPQSPPDACPDGREFTPFTAVAANWTQALIAGAPTDATRSTDTVVAIFQDPASVSPAQLFRFSVQVSTGSSKTYQTDEVLVFNKQGGGTITSVVEDVFPPVNGGTALQVLAIYNTSPGRVVIVPSQMAMGPDKPQFDPTGDPIPATVSSNLLSGQLADLRRGSLVQIGSEVCLVLTVVTGPLGNITFEAAVTQVHIAGETIIGIPAIACSGLSSLVVGQTVTSAEIDSTLTFSTGNNIGTLSQTFGTNPFNQSLGNIGPPQEDDLIHISVKIDLPANLTAFRIIFDVGDGSFTQNLLYYEVNVNALQAVVSNTATQLSAVTTAESQVVIDNTAGDYSYDNPKTGEIVRAGRGVSTRNIGSLQTGSLELGTGASQWTEITFPITQLTRVGTDQTKTLATCVGVQVLVNCTATVHIGIGSLWVGGGGQLDIGLTGSPYFYRVRPRSVSTGARGNPSPSMRHGLYNRLQPNVLTLPSAAYDSQIEVWDIERYGGSVTTWRLVGTVAASATTYVDNALDAAALAGEVLDFDNFEPWPTVDIPYTATVGVNGITAISVIGTIITILGPPAAFPQTIMRWLAGTLITLNGQLTYTLNSRPQPIAGGVLFFISENASAPTVSTLYVNEPVVAAQPLPYVWGPDSNGVIFACGDPLRPGFLYSAKQFAPDISPNNPYDLTPPSEALLGGEIVDGVSVGASSKRWWILQPAFSEPKRWNPVEIPAGRGLAAPFGHCTDGKLIYFWAKDGIYSMVPGLPAISLTDADIGNLFPQDGVATIPSDITYGSGGVVFTIQAPNYAYAARFRLSIINNILRAHYFDRNGVARVLRFDMTLDSSGQPRNAWSADQYFDPICVSYQPEQPPGTLQSVSSAYTEGFFGDVNGRVHIETDKVNDRNNPIPCAIAVPEFDAGDHRIPKQWFDAFVDIDPETTVTGLAMYQRASLQTFSIGAKTSRQLTINALGSSVTGFLVQNFLGLMLSYTDDVNGQSGTQTILYGWSYEYAVQPMLIRSWQSVPTSHGLQGYHFIYRIRFAYQSFSVVTLTITAFDGTSPATITLPNTSGAFRKVEFIPSFNKGLLFTYQGTTDDPGLPWAPIIDQCEILVGQWGRTGPCTVFRGLGGVEAA